MVYHIHEANMERLEKQLARVQAKCRKYGCDFHYAVVGEEFHKRIERDGLLSRPVTERYVLVEAEGIAIVNGWQFMAKLDHQPEGNYVTSICDGEIPIRFYTDAPVCEHCRTRRVRRFTYILRNRDTGEWIQVGKQCLRDFTGGMDAGFYASCLDGMAELEKGTVAPSEHYGDWYPRDLLLSSAAEAVRVYGYVPGSCYDSTRSTALRYFDADQCGDSMSHCLLDAVRKEMEEKGVDIHSARAQAEVEAALKWLDSAKEDSDYMHNLKLACSREYIAAERVGIAVSLFSAYRKAVEASRREAGSDWVGEVGKRVEFRIADLDCITSWFTPWGCTRLYLITDQDGNAYTWKTGTDVDDDDAAGRLLRGTVKEHIIYGGRRETALTRCRMVG